MPKPVARLRIVRLPDTSKDDRGESFTVPADVIESVAPVRDIHIASIVPAAVRGDHYHLRRKELIIVSWRSSWVLHWDEGPETPPSAEYFDGAGTAAIMVHPWSSHAIENTGTSPLWMCALSTEAYDPLESVRRIVSRSEA